MKKIVLVALLALIISCGDNKQEDRAIVEEQEYITPQLLEKQNPLQYCKIEKTEIDGNFWGTKVKYYVYIKNIAKYTEYKDLDINIQYLSKTGSVIDEKKYTRFDYFQPNHTYKIGFELPTPPKATEKYNIQLIGLKYSKEI